MVQNDNTPRCYSYIRFSTPEQITGNSLDRQLDLARTYAKEKGIVLDESLRMTDLGLSAFSGEHRIRGVLGEFLDLIRKGRVPKKSILLVESLDRLSREQVYSALLQFMEIINSDITIVTLADKVEYNKETIAQNNIQLILSIFIMSRAYEESLQKSKRIGSAWKAKRDKVSEAKLTAKCPAWLYLNKTNNTFELHEDRCRLIKRTFSLSLAGKGAASIAKQYNSEGIPPWKSQNGWHPSYIQKILHSRAVLGEFQPHKVDNKKRVPIGVPIKNYFPQIITDETFYQVQNRLKSNTNKGGKNGKISNLFGGIAKCGYCGSSMQIINKGAPKGGKYLVCDSAKRGLGCYYELNNYTDIEESFLIFCKGLNVSDLLNEDNDTQKNKMDILEGKFLKLQNDIEVCGRRIENLIETISDEDRKEIKELLKNRIEGEIENKTQLMDEQRKIKSEIDETAIERQNITESIDGIRTLYNMMATLDEKQVIDVRIKIRSAIRQLVDRVDVYSLGKVTTDDTINQLKEIEMMRLMEDKSLTTEEAQNAAEERIKNYLNEELKTRKTRKHFVIKFKNGDFRALYPSPNLFPKYQVVAEKNSEDVMNPYKFISLTQLNLQKESETNNL